VGGLQCSSTLVGDVSQRAGRAMVVAIGCHAAPGEDVKMLDTGRKRILLVEDQALVSMLVEEELTEAGYTVVGPFSTCAAALNWLRDDTPDLAILDLQLRDGPATELARELQRRKVGFAVFSGAMKAEAAQIFQQAPWIEKPSCLAQLKAVLATLATQAAPATPLTPGVS
jgi:DNA-binding response OmpR family regulator